MKQVTRVLALSAAIVFGLPAVSVAQTGARGGTPEVGTPAAVAPYAPLATITESFDTLAGTSPNQCPTGWICSNVSSPLGSTNWFQGNSGVFPAQAGPATGYIGANFNNTTGANTISNWLITPVMQFGNGAELRFWARAAASGSQFPDRLEIRTSTGGSSNGGTATSTGDFTNLIGTINPNLQAVAGTCVAPAGAPNSGGFPEAWCEYLLTNADGIPTTGTGRIAFRYHVTNGGPSGANSNYVGIDTFSFVEGIPLVPMTSNPASGSTITMPAYTVGNPAVGSTITFANSNATAGTVTCTAPSPAEFTLSPLVINVPANGNANATVSFSAAAPGNFAGTLSCSGSGGETFNFNLSAVAAAGAAPGVPVPAMNDSLRLFLLVGVFGLGIVALRRRWA